MLYLFITILLASLEKSLLSSSFISSFTKHAANFLVFFLSTTYPDFSLRIISEQPPTSKTTDGMPAALASTNVFGRLSAATGPVCC